MKIFNYINPVNLFRRGTKAPAPSPVIFEHPKKVSLNRETQLRVDSLKNAGLSDEEIILFELEEKSLEISREISLKLESIDIASLTPITIDGIGSRVEIIASKNIDPTTNEIGEGLKLHIRIVGGEKNNSFPRDVDVEKLSEYKITVVDNNTQKSSDPIAATRHVSRYSGWNNRDKDGKIIWGREIYGNSPAEETNSPHWDYVVGKFELDTATLENPGFGIKSGLEYDLSFSVSKKDDESSIETPGVIPIPAIIASRKLEPVSQLV